MNLALKNINLPLADFALSVDLTITAQVTALCGPSGSGKTSLLDLIAGLRRPESAYVQLGDRVLCDTKRGIDIPVRERRIGYVPQDLALFPHLSVRRNLLYGQRSRDAAADNLFSYEHVTGVLDIHALADRGVAKLSGGEKQRVALGRALLSSPGLLLLDEPLASLDSALKSRIIPYLTRVRDEFHVPMIVVTHSVEEVQPLCSQTLQMERGQIVRC